MRACAAVAALAVAGALCARAAAAVEPREYPLGAVPKAVYEGEALCKAQAVDRCSGEPKDRAMCVKCLLDRCMVRAESAVRCERPERTTEEAAGSAGSGSESAKEILASAATGVDFLRGVRRREEERAAQRQVQRQLSVAPWEWEVRAAAAAAAAAAYDPVGRAGGRGAPLVHVHGPAAGAAVWAPHRSRPPQVVWAQRAPGKFLPPPLLHPTTSASCPNARRCHDAPQLHRSPDPSLGRPARGRRPHGRRTAHRARSALRRADS